MIDNGLCFCGLRWDLPYQGSKNLYHDRSVYRDVARIEDFEPWLGRLEHLVQRSVLEAIAASIPTQWCIGEHGDLNSLVEELDRRRWLVRGEMTLKYLRDGHFQN